MYNAAPLGVGELRLGPVEFRQTVPMLQIRKRPKASAGALMRISSHFRPRLQTSLRRLYPGVVRFFHAPAFLYVSWSMTHANL
jgi:hypothetical protein